jgi:hypothetical protein
MPKAQLQEQTLSLQEQLKQFENFRKYAQRRYMFFFDSLLEAYDEDRSKLLNNLFNAINKFLLYKVHVAIGKRNSSSEFLASLLVICNEQLQSIKGKESQRFKRLAGVVKDLNVYIEKLQEKLSSLPSTDLFSAKDYLEYLTYLSSKINQEFIFNKNQLHELITKNKENLLEIREEEITKFVIRLKIFDVNNHQSDTTTDSTAFELRNKLIKDFALLQKYAEKLLLPVKRELSLLVAIYEKLSRNKGC